jgi:hypothetical protein
VKRCRVARVSLRGGGFLAKEKGGEDCYIAEKGLLLEHEQWQTRAKLMCHVTRDMAVTGSM